MNSLYSTSEQKTVKVKNEDTRKICGTRKLFEIFIDESLLRWYGHVECRQMIGRRKWYMAL